MQMIQFYIIINNFYADNYKYFGKCQSFAHEILI